MHQQRIIMRYSHAFKQKVVSEIESGKFTIYQAQKVYGIAGSVTIQKWLHRLGKTHLLNKVIHIQMRDEKDKIKELEKQKQALESALAQAQLKIITLESTIAVLEEEAGLTVKKNTVTGSSNGVVPTPDSTKDGLRSRNSVR